MNLKKISNVRGLRLFYPTVPVIVTAKSGGRFNAMPAAWATPLSFIPPLVAVSIAPERYTYRLITESGYFALNWVDFKYVKEVVYLGEVSGRYRGDKVSAAGFTVVKGERVPVLGEAVGVVECRLKERFEVGDHDLFVGECLAAYVSEDFTETWRLKDYSPLLSLGSVRGVKRRRRFLSLEKEVVDVLCPVGEEVDKREKTVQRIREMAENLSKESGRPIRLSEVASKVAEELSIDSVDAELIAEQLRREGRIRAVRG
ncbi:MAG: flavin reductase family protein [Nitrososphaerales archaeon]